MGGYGGYHHHHNHNHHQAGAGGMGTTAFPSATAFPHYAIHQGIPFPATNLYGFVSLSLSPLSLSIHTCTHFMMTSIAHKHIPIFIAI